MGIFGDRYAFAGEPPSREDVERELSDRMGSPQTLFGYGRRDNDLIVYCPLDDILHFYTMSVLVDLVGTRIDFSTREPRPEVLPAFVRKRWLEHDDAARAAIKAEYDMKWLNPRG